MATFAQALAGLVPSTSYKPPKRRTLVSRRTALPGKQLAVDLLLPPGVDYPPSGVEALSRLVAEIETHEAGWTSQIFALLYVFMDAGADVASHFVSEVHLPESQARLVRALWSLDRGITDSSVIRDLCWPWELDSSSEMAERIHRVVVTALAGSVVELTAYVDAKAWHVVSKDSQIRELYVGALLAEQRYERVVEVWRLTRDESIFDALATAGGNSKAAAKRIANLRLSPDEWSLFYARLEPLISADPSGPAARLAFVRSLHVGDLPIVHQLKPLDPRFEEVSHGIGDF